MPLSPRVRNTLKEAAFKTVGEVRQTSNANLLSLQNLGRGSSKHLRELFQ
ncbi:DNA-directed RNA polymerase subunit alpha C-terminal domain-containing protein [Bradyrhizobium genosp. P]